MAISKKQKSEIINDLKERIINQKSIVFVETKNLKTKNIESLKKDLKKEKCSFLVVKKTLLNMVLKEMKISPIEFKNQFGLAYGVEDEIIPAKIVYQKSLSEDSVKILGGILEKDFKTEEEIISLAKLPSRDILLQRLMGSISSPTRSFLTVLEANIKGFINVLGAIKK